MGGEEAVSEIKQSHDGHVFSSVLVGMVEKLRPVDELGCGYGRLNVALFRIELI